ncbi:MAG: ATP-dependent helicase HrpB, partial [Firmicutes bacterium]|nr:ATP-dependent helicase HrpB [Bacillota bacterium]
GAVIFDEFHERSLHADLGLALALQSQALLREDLRILVMSATLEPAPVAALLGDAPVLTSEGRSFSVETHYVNVPADVRIESAVARAVIGALRADDGDILVFLPGAGEIRRVAALLGEADLGRGVNVLPLYGGLPQYAQDDALEPAAPGERKVVLATAIAETSLTVEGVRVIIDSGLMRVPRFSPRTGMTRLETVPVSRASADQRRGRAGRLGPGVCYRLWPERDDRGLAARSTPEILEADLAPLALELAAWGVSDPAELLWLDAPPAAALAQARELLRQLGALAADGAITAHGRQMADLGLHPRLAHMLLRAVPLRLGSLACELAALLSERDILPGERDGDLRHRIDAVRGFGYHSVDFDAIRRIKTEADRWKQALRLPPRDVPDDEATGLLLAFAYPDRIAQRRPGGGFLLRNGRGARFAQPQPLANQEYIVAADLDDQGPESRIFLGAPVSLGDLERHVADQIIVESLVAWDPGAQAVRARRRERLGALVLLEAPIANPDPEEALAALLQGIRSTGLELLPWTKSARQLQERLIFMHRFEPGWPDASDAALAATVGDWLAPHLYGMRSRDNLQRLKLAEILGGLLSWAQREALDEGAPTHMAVPSGSRIPIDYSDPTTPVLAVRLQELFGLAQTPRIAHGRVPLTLHLLSPARRPVQVTQDLASFWQNAYFAVRKDLRGRYPKHYWPEDPLAATPTSRTRPRT